MEWSHNLCISSLQRLAVVQRNVFKERIDDIPIIFMSDFLFLSYLHWEDIPFTITLAIERSDGAEILKIELINCDQQ